VTLKALAALVVLSMVSVLGAWVGYQALYCHTPILKCSVFAPPAPCCPEVLQEWEDWIKAHPLQESHY